MVTKWEGKKVQVIGVMGVQKGIGTTHSSLLTAAYYRKRGYQVALIEWGEQEAFTRIKTMYEGGGQIKNEEGFIIKRIHHYPKFQEQHLNRIRKEGFHVIVIDFGCYQEALINYYNDLDMQLLIGQGIDWKVHEIDRILSNVSPQLCADWKILLPFGDEDEVYDVKKLSNLKTYYLPFHKNPYQLSKEVYTQLDYIVRN
ncbi:MAG: anti-sigma factor antagonist [Vallitaleaceae bacterium]|nr:anti-sigma factor antagonist [Vallitaleaceae bacterium]